MMLCVVIVMQLWSSSIENLLFNTEIQIYFYTSAMGLDLDLDIMIS